MKIEVYGLKETGKAKQTIMIQWLEPGEKKPRKITKAVKNGDILEVPDQVGWKIMSQYGESHLRVASGEPEASLPKLRTRVSVPAKNKIAPEAK